MDALKEYINKLSSDYKVEIKLSERDEHIDVFPPHGGMNITVYYITIGTDSFEIGSNYGGNFVSMKQKAKSCVLERAEWCRLGTVLSKSYL